MNGSVPNYYCEGGGESVRENADVMLAGDSWVDACMDCQED